MTVRDGGVIDGFPAGIKIDMDFVQQELNRRRPGPWDSPKLVNRKILPNELNILLVVLKVSFRKDNDFRDNILDCC